VAPAASTGGLPQDIPPDHYTVERELGHGGMATVYVARDIKHGRRVALKMLRPELTASLGAERFRREITLAASLQHPHIVPVHDSGETASGVLWFTMPLIEGESLRDRIKRQHQLPVDEAIRITREVALALDYAHRHGVIHRDIKPENILLVDEQPLVADFGIARAIEAAACGETLTATGIAVGTPAYMSPEQAAGERTVEPATDIYSLAVLALGAYDETTGHYAEAAERYRAAYRLDPNAARAYYWAGDIESYTGNWKEALQDYTRAAALNPGDWTYHSRAGVAYEALREYPEAEREYDRQLALAPHFVGGYWSKARLFVNARGDTAGARRLYDTALVRCGSQQLATALARLWLAPARLPDALLSVPLAAFAGDTTGYYLLRASVYRQHGSPALARVFADSARVRLERTIKKRYVSERVHTSLALVYQYLGRPGDATREVQAAEIALQRSPGATDAVKYVRAYIRARSGDVTTALADLKDQVDGPSIAVSRAQLAVDPNWDFLRNDLRFRRLIADTAASVPQ
jgi:tetratricopeptide (TPR) repeat protein/tRNA A-37 threonylcarbamoyl transferase component Bud32